ncbi:MAG: hypothetical protein MJ198_01205 [Bacteroidales bacterium]|nr:hypothetical protein [Bacteroidales bacterium]
MGKLKELNIVGNEDAQTVVIFESLFESKTFLDVCYSTPKEYVSICWAAYQQNSKKNNNLNGKIFELIIYTLLYRENILPFYSQAKVAFVPNIEFDTILYSKSTPVSLSLKTSLRERYKQADLEAIALKYVHRRAQCYLLTLSSEEANNVKNKVNDGSIIGLDKIIDCNTNDIDDLIVKLREITFQESQKIEVVEGFLVKK